MPSVNEIWEQALQINANLVTVHQDLQALNTCCELNHQDAQATNQWLTNLFSLTNQGFINLSLGVAGVHERQDLANALLQHQIQQQDTVICLLDKMARDLCDLVNVADRQLRTMSAMAVDTAAIRHMTESSQPAAALEQRRAAEARAALEVCCPPEAEQPRCEFEPCEMGKMRELPMPRQYEPFEGMKPREPEGKPR